ncbi:MAG: hypothetical protein ACI9N1_001327 [Flavobacteriales bacterium]|jgi:hypothetical protein
MKFTKDILNDLGDVSDLLGAFLEEQIEELDDPSKGLIVLKSFVSAKGTKRQITSSEVLDFSKSLGSNLAGEELQSYIQKFVNLRILRDKDENGRYELRHDALAAKIYEKITVVEKEVLEVRQFIEGAYDSNLKRGVLLSPEDLRYMAPYEDKLFLDKKVEAFIQESKAEAGKKKRRRQLLFGTLITLFVVGISYYAYSSYQGKIEAEKQQASAEKQGKIDKANYLASEALLQVDSDPTLTFLLAEKSLEIMKTPQAYKALFDSYEEGVYSEIKIEGQNFLPYPFGSFDGITINIEESEIYVYPGFNKLRKIKFEGNAPGRIIPDKDTSYIYGAVYQDSIIKRWNVNTGIEKIYKIPFKFTGLELDVESNIISFTNDNLDLFFYNTSSGNIVNSISGCEKEGVIRVLPNLVVYPRTDEIILFDRKGIQLSILDSLDFNIQQKEYHELKVESCNHNLIFYLPGKAWIFDKETKSLNLLWDSPGNHYWSAYQVEDDYFINFSNYAKSYEAHSSLINMKCAIINVDSYRSKVIDGRFEFELENKTLLFSRSLNDTGELVLYNQDFEPKLELRGVITVPRVYTDNHSAYFGISSVKGNDFIYSVGEDLFRYDDLNNKSYRIKGVNEDGRGAYGVAGYYFSDFIISSDLRTELGQFHISDTLGRLIKTLSSEVNPLAQGFYRIKNSIYNLMPGRFGLKYFNNSEITGYSMGDSLRIFRSNDNEFTDEFLIDYNFGIEGSKVRSIIFDEVNQSALTLFTNSEYHLNSIRYQNKSSTVDHIFNSTIYSIDYDRESGIVYGLSDSSYFEIDMVSYKVDSFSLSERVVSILMDFKEDDLSTIMNSGRGNDTEVKLFNNRLIIIDSSKVIAHNLATNEDIILLNVKAKLSLVNLNENLLYLYSDQGKLYCYNTALELINELPINIENKGVVELFVMENNNELLVVKSDAKIVNSKLGFTSHYDYKFLPQEYSYYSAEMKHIESNQNNTVKSNGYESHTCRIKESNFVWTGDKLVYLYDNEFYLIRGQNGKTHAWGKQLPFINNMNSICYQAHSMDAVEGVYDNYFVDFKPATPEEIFKRVRKDKQFGQIRDFTPEEKKKYGI